MLLRVGLVEDQNDGLMSGSFRWGKSKKLLPLPPPPPAMPPVLKGWPQYLAGRGGPDLTQRAQTDPALLDALSFPMTLVWALSRLELVAPKVESVFHIIVLGATVKAEEHILRNSNYFHELAHYCRVIES